MFFLVGEGKTVNRKTGVVRISVVECFVLDHAI